MIRESFTYAEWPTDLMRKEFNQQSLVRRFITEHGNPLNEFHHAILDQKIEYSRYLIELK